MNTCGCKRIGLPVSEDLLIKFREREKEIKITELEKKKLSCHFTMWVYGQVSLNKKCLSKTLGLFKNQDG